MLVDVPILAVSGFVASVIVDLSTGVNVSLMGLLSPVVDVVGFVKSATLFKPGTSVFDFGISYQLTQVLM